MKWLVVIDRSEFSWKALERAVEMAKTEKAELHILHVNEQHSDMLEYAPMVELNKAFMEIGQELIEKAKAFAVSKGVDAKAHLSQDTSPAGGILGFMKDKGFDLLFVGSHGRGALEAFLLGSVAARLVRHSPCSVFVVR